MPAAICNRFGIAYFSTPKAASTSMKMVLYELENGTPWTEDPNRVHPQFRTFPVTPDDFEAARAHWCFTILRDPISRLLSAYGNRVHHHQDIEKAAKKNPRFRLKHPSVELRPSADVFYENLELYQDISYSIWHHTVSVRQFIGSDLAFFDAIFQIHDILELEQELSAKTGRAITLPLEQTSGQKITLDMLSPKARANVLAYTAQDYDLLGDYFQRPSR